jgi:hypothetical protein
MLLLAAACHGHAEHVGQACSRAEQCYADVKPELRGGAAVCLTRVRGGYCTHPCSTDSDCCAVDGECPGGLRQVCAPFESTKSKLCFIACTAAEGEEDEEDEADACRSVNDAFICRSSGGGSQNRKICVPPG